MLRVTSIFFVIWFVLSASVRAESLAALALRADLDCVDFRVIGACRRSTPPFAGVRVRYRQPVLLVETVKLPGRVMIDELRPLAGKFLQSLGNRTIASAAECQAAPDSGSAYAADTTALQMNDVHVYGFPLSDQVSALILAPCEGPPDLAGPLSYLSEIDAAEWRVGRGEAGHPLARLLAAAGPVCENLLHPLSAAVCLGSWGPLFPRTGQLVHYSEAVGSAVAAYRAVDIASLNMLVAHRIIVPAMFSPDKLRDRLQMVFPSRSHCLRVGERADLWENGRRSPDGSYVWIYWRQKECCLF